MKNQGAGEKCKKKRRKTGKRKKRMQGWIKKDEKQIQKN